MGSDQPAAPFERAAISALTRGVVKVYAEYLGKGPLRARTERNGPDGVMCVLRETLTPVEQTLIERGRSTEVHALRRSFQDVMAPEFCKVVEEALGRPVVAFLSQVHLDPDISVEIFFLGPRQDGANVSGDLSTTS